MKGSQKQLIDISSCCEICREYLAYLMLEPRASPEQLKQNAKTAKKFYLKHKKHIDFSKNAKDVL